MKYTKEKTSNGDIRLSVTVKVLLAIIVRHGSHQEMKVHRVSLEIYRVCNSIERAQ